MYPHGDLCLYCACGYLLIVSAVMAFLVIGYGESITILIDRD